MTRSRHSRSGGSGEGAGEPGGLPSWAQRHLDESGYAPAVTTSHRRSPARGRAESPLRGWGLAILSVAAAVTAVPLAVNAVANDRSDDPLPTVDTFTAGAPQALPGGESGPATRRGASDVVGDPVTGGILTVPGAAPAGPQAAAPAPVVPAPLPAAVVRPTTPVVPQTITPRNATPTTTPTTKPTTTTSGEDEGQGRSTTPTSPPKSTSGSKQAPSGGNGGGGQKQEGLVPQVADTAGKTVNGLGKAVGGLL